MTRCLHATLSLVVALLLSSCAEHKGEFVLLNKSSETITEATVSICGQTLTFERVQSGGSVNGTYTVTSDSHFTIHVEFEDGSEMTKEIGYVTYGMNFWHQIAITESNIEITESKAQYNSG